MSLSRAVTSRLVLPAAALAALVLAAPAVAAAKPADADAQLTKAMSKLVGMLGGPPAVAVVVQRDGQRRFRTAGTADVKSGARWRVTDHMRLASVAKAFSGAAALELVGKGQLKLDAGIGTLLPWLPAAWGGVTVAQALQHTSGLPDYTSAPAFQKFFSKNLRAYVAPKELVGFVAGDPLNFAPGSEYRYSNTDNIVIGLIVEALSGMPYPRFLRQRVAAPLSMPETTLPTDWRLPSPHVEGYEVSPGEPPENVTTALSMSGAWASGGVQSTPADLNRFVRGYVGGRLFDAATQARQMSFVAGHSEPPGPGTNSAGLGVFRYKTKCGTVYGHTGNLPGFTQFAAASPDGSRSVTVSVNARVIPTAENAKVRAAFGALRNIYGLGVCAALAR